MPRTLLNGLPLGAFIFLWVTIAGSASAVTVASDVSDVCAIFVNLCSGGIANINVVTTTACPSVLGAGATRHLAFREEGPKSAIF